MSRSERYDTNMFSRFGAIFDQQLRYSRELMLFFFASDVFRHHDRLKDKENIAIGVNSRIPPENENPVANYFLTSEDLS